MLDTLWVEKTIGTFSKLCFIYALPMLETLPVNLREKIYLYIQPIFGSYWPTNIKSKQVNAEKSIFCCSNYFTEILPEMFEVIVLQCASGI